MCLVDGQGHIIFGQRSIACYITTIDFKVQFMQVYSVIQNCTWLIIFGIDHKDSCNSVFGVLIISNIASLATVPIPHQEIIKQCRGVQEIANTSTNERQSTQSYNIQYKYNLQYNTYNIQ